jgi:hypothetical protein
MKRVFTGVCAILAICYWVDHRIAVTELARANDAYSRSFEACSKHWGDPAPARTFPICVQSWIDHDRVLLASSSPWL